MRGSKPGERRGGRDKGTPNKRTAEREAAMREAADKIAGALGEDAFDGDAHALLIAVYKDGSHPIEIRIDAAKAAIGYERPRLQAIAHSGPLGGPIGVSVEDRRAERARIERECDEMMAEYDPSKATAHAAEAK